MQGFMNRDATGCDDRGLAIVLPPVVGQGLPLCVRAEADACRQRKLRSLGLRKPQNGRAVAW
jgi:hypothetical protein